MDIVDKLMGAVTKTALTHCSVDGNKANVSVFFSHKEMEELGQGGVMVFVPRRMEGLIKEESGRALFLPSTFFEEMEYEDTGDGKIFSYEGKVCDEKRDDSLIFEAMDDMGIQRPIEE